MRTILFTSLMALVLTTGFTCSKNTPEEKAPEASQEQMAAPADAAPSTTEVPAAAPTEAQPAGETH